MNKISTTLADKDRENSIAHAKKEKNRTKKSPTRRPRMDLSHAEIAEYAETYRTKLRRIAIHKILRFLRAKKNYSTTIFRVMPFIFTKYKP